MDLLIYNLILTLALAVNIAQASPTSYYTGGYSTISDYGSITLGYPEKKEIWHPMLYKYRKPVLIEKREQVLFYSAKLSEDGFKIILLENLRVIGNDKGTTKIIAEIPVKEMFFFASSTEFTVIDDGWCLYSDNPSKKTITEFLEALDGKQPSYMDNSKYYKISSKYTGKKVLGVEMHRFDGKVIYKAFIPSEDYEETPVLNVSRVLAFKKWLPNHPLANVHD